MSGTVILGIWWQENYLILKEHFRYKNIEKILCKIIANMITKGTYMCCITASFLSALRKSANWTATSVNMKLFSLILCCSFEIVCFWFSVILGNKWMVKCFLCYELLHIEKSASEKSLRYRNLNFHDFLRIFTNFHPIIIDECRKRPLGNLLVNFSIFQFQFIPSVDFTFSIIIHIWCCPTILIPLS